MKQEVDQIAVELRNARLNYRQYDPGHIMENIIYNELVKRGYSVDVGVVKERKKDERIHVRSEKRP